MVPVTIGLALVSLTVVGLILGNTNPLLSVLVVPIAAVLLAGLVKSIRRRPRLFLAATYGANTTTERQGTRFASAAVVLFLRNQEGAGPAQNCKVELTAVAASPFHLEAGHDSSASEYVVEDPWQIVWQPTGDLPPGGERELRLKSVEFAFGDSVRATVRVTAERMDPFERTLDLRVGRYEGLSAELEVSV